MDGDAHAAAKFRRYSFRNVLLILRQRPGAIQVAGYRTWQALGRQVRRGEHGIAALAPVTYRRQESSDADHDTERERDEGVRQVRGFTVEHVFDISQTEGEELPVIAPVALTGDAPDGLWDAIVAQIEGDGFTVRRNVCADPGANGGTSWSTHTVTVRGDLDPAQACRTLVHERAHIALRHGEDLGAVGCRGRIEVEAESVAFMVSSEVGLTAASYSLPYVAHWANGDSTVIADTAERVITAARMITDALAGEGEGVTPVDGGSAPATAHAPAARRLGHLRGAGRRGVTVEAPPHPVTVPA